MALLSILRTLGVPAKDVFATFSGGESCARHAFVVYKCDESLPENLKLEECNGHWGEWLVLDATNHFIRPLEETDLCQNMCAWYNDYGLYASINPSLYGFGGRIDEDTGYAFPKELNCKVGEACVLNKVCSIQGVKCI